MLGVNGFAWDLEWVQCSLDVSNYSDLKHFASYSEWMLYVRVGRMLMNQRNVRHVHCDELNGDVGWLKVNPGY